MLSEAQLNGTRTRPKAAKAFKPERALSRFRIPGSRLGPTNDLKASVEEGTLLNAFCHVATTGCSFEFVASSGALPSWDLILTNDSSAGTPHAEARIRCAYVEGEYRTPWTCGGLNLSGSASGGAG